MKNDEVKQLNNALKGEHMAIESFDHYIQDAANASVKEKLQEIQKTHQTHAAQLAYRIQQLGGNPVNTAGVSGAIAEIKMRVSPKKYIDDNLLKSAIEGEEIGIKAYTNIISNLQDGSNKNLVQGMLAENQAIMDDLNRQLSQFPIKP